MVGSGREAVIDYELLRERQNETVVKEICVASAAASETFRLKPPYKMPDHGSTENGINWIDGHIEYSELHMVLNEAVVGFAHLYAYGVSKCRFLAELTGRPIHNLEDVNCPLPTHSITSVGVPCPATSFPNSLAQTKARIPLRLVDVLSAEERFLPMPIR